VTCHRSLARRILPGFLLTVCSQEDGHIVPGRFQQVVGFHDYSVQQQHPCYTTSSRDLGKKKPQVINSKFVCRCVYISHTDAQVVDMPLRWHGAAGHFTKEFEMNVPGAKSVEVNQYRCRSLNVIQTKSKVRVFVVLTSVVDTFSHVDAGS
jgi:hypothetical protein